METIRLTLGSKLELVRYTDDGQSIMPVLVSQFETQMPDGSMEILAPIHEGRIFSIYPETVIDVIYLENGDLFKFSAIVLERKISDNIHLLMIQPQSAPERYQRRNFFRFSCLLDVKYRLFEQNSGTKKTQGEFKKAVTKDLSGGGVCLLLNEKPSRGDILEGIINVGCEIRFKGRIVRVANVSDKGKFSYEAGVEFTDITNLNREKVISFIFDLQRKLLKKGWHNK